MNEWEDMSVDMVQWNVMSKQFEDLSFLVRMIRYVPVYLRETQSQNLCYPIDETIDNLEFSLVSILQKGRGGMSIALVSCH